MAVSEQRPSPKQLNNIGSDYHSGGTQAFLRVICIGCLSFCIVVFLLNFLELSFSKVSARKTP